MAPARFQQKTELNKRLLAYAAVVPALAVAGAGNAGAAQILDFTGPYAFGNWTQTIGGTGSIVDGSPGDIELRGSNSPGLGGPAVDVDFTIAAVGTGTVSFSWDWFNSDYIPSADLGQWLLNGTPVTLSGSAGSSSGSSSFAVTTGDIFGFRVRATDDCCGAGHLKIKEFSAPEGRKKKGGGEIPEPSTVSLMALGVAGLLLARRRRAKA